MTYAIAFSRRFLKIVKKWKKGGQSALIAAAEEAAQLLAVSNAPARFILREQWRDHALTGNLRGRRELHLSQDDLLIYEIHEDIKEIHLIDVVSHEELRKW